jgi:hypothetical protein
VGGLQKEGGEISYTLAKSKRIVASLQTERQTSGRVKEETETNEVLTKQFTTFGYLNS